MQADLPIACSSIFMAQIGASAPLPEFVIMTLCRINVQTLRLWQSVITLIVPCWAPSALSKPHGQIDNPKSQNIMMQYKQSLSTKRVAVANFSPKFMPSFCIGDRSAPSCCLHTDENPELNPTTHYRTGARLAFSSEFVLASDDSTSSDSESTTTASSSEYFHTGIASLMKKNPKTK